MSINITAPITLPPVIEITAPLTFGWTGAAGATGAPGPNAVTSATTSDGTAALTVATIQATTLLSNTIKAVDATGNLRSMHEDICLQWGLSGNKNLIVPASTDFRINTTTFTFGAGADSAMKTALAIASADITDATANNTNGTVVKRTTDGTPVYFGDGNFSGALETATTFGAGSTIAAGGGFIFFRSGGSVLTTVDVLATASRNINFPDASGTVALTSDIVNSVTSATTSDGTCDLSVLTLQTAGSVTLVAGGINMLDDDGQIVVNGTSSGSGVLARNYFAFGSVSASLREGNTSAACLTWGDGGNQNLTIPTGTALTFDNTSFAYGTGAALAHGTAMGFNDSRIASFFTSPYISIADHFLGLFAGANGNGFLNWLTVGSNMLWSSISFMYPGFLGGTVIYNNNNACFNYLLTTAAASISNYNSVVFDFVFFTSSPISNESIFVGIRSVASSTVETGRKGLWYESGVDTNWQLLHETSAGVRTKIDTGKAVEANQTVRVTMKFVSGTQTDLIIATSTNTTPVTVSATSGFSCTGSLGLGFGLRSTIAANRFLIPMRAVLAWQPPTL